MPRAGGSKQQALAEMLMSWCVWWYNAESYSQDTSYTPTDLTVSSREPSGSNFSLESSTRRGYASGPHDYSAAAATSNSCPDGDLLPPHGCAAGDAQANGGFSGSFNQLPADGNGNGTPGGILQVS